MLLANVVLIDLKRSIAYHDHFTVFKQEGVTHELRQNHFFSNYGFFTSLRISQMCRTLFRRLSPTKFLLYGSVFLHGLCSAYFSRKPSRYRSLSSVYSKQTLAHGFSWQNISLDFSRLKRKTRLANLRRLCSSINQHCKKVICQRFFQRRSKSNGLRSRFNNNRFMPFFISMGSVSQKKISHKAPHVVRPKGLNTLLHTHYPWFRTRSEYIRPTHSITRFRLCYGSRLHRLRTSLSFKRTVSFFCRTIKKQSCLSKALFQQSRQSYRPQSRSDYSANGASLFTTLSRKTSSNKLSRPRDKYSLHFPYKQLYLTCFDGNSTLQKSLANRNILQMDQTTFKNKSFLWYFSQCCENSNLDCYFGLLAHCHNQKKTQYRTQPLHYSTDSEHYCF